MAQAPSNPFVAALAAGGTSVEEALKQLQKNAMSKQYDMHLAFMVTESPGGKKFYEATSDWSGVQYPIVVVTEALMVELLKKFVELGGAISTGGETPPPA